MRIVAAITMAMTSSIALGQQVLPEFYEGMRTLCTPSLVFMEAMTADHFGSRGSTSIKEIVLHDTQSPSGRKYKDAVEYMASPDDGRVVSIHYYLGRDFGQLVKMVPEEKRAFHAKSHNAKSIGIEMFKRQDDDPSFTIWQNQVIAELVFDIMFRRGIAFGDVVGHSEIQSNKPDPEGFDWDAFEERLRTIDECAAGFSGTSIM